MTYTLTRQVGLDECPWLSLPLEPGATVYRFNGNTLGAVERGWVAVTKIEGELPFYVVPKSAVRRVKAVA